MNLIFAILNIALISYLILKLASRWECTKNKLFWGSFFCHLVAGISVGLIYRYYYAANDTWFFFENASNLADIGFRNFLDYIKILFDFSDVQNPVIQTEDFRSIVFIKLLSLFCLASRNSYWICTFYFSVFSFVSSWVMFRTIVSLFPESSASAALSFLFFPSVIFWSSGIEKETLALSALYLLAAFFLSLLKEKRISFSWWTIAAFSILILWVLKYYWAVVFLMSALATIAVNVLSNRFSVFKQNRKFIFFLSFILLGVFASFLHPNFYLDRFLEVITSNHQEFVIKSDPKNLIHFSNLNPSLWSFIINSPWALISGFFRPFLGEGNGPLGIAASVENSIILILVVTSLINHIRKKPKIDILFLATLSYCLVLCVFLTLSTPNLGTLSRYRIGFLPFLVFLVSYKNSIIDLILKNTRSKNL